MRILNKYLIICTLFIIAGCEEVVDIDLEESTPKLVIEASLLKVKSIPDTPHYIILTKTAPFFEEEIPPATEAEVKVTDSDGQVYIFEEIDPGLYRNEVLEAEPGKSYHLQINYLNETYEATSTYTPVADLEYVEQNNEGGFNGDDIELRAFYTDPPEIGNYYLFRFLYDELSLQIYEDEFINGNRSFAVFTNEDLKEGDRVSFEIQGISRRYYEYLFILRSQAGSGGGPFQTQPTVVRGNIVNTTNPANFPLGFFRVSEVDRLHYTVE
ncbi:DUF4249 domain-containing protein [Antarcticibacterium sp. 1MA-6-2]|uniref:DUF4249 domain-containing protein n=1 Tax=Antarcticibacterium sp. 1MA-6-2 TaxID=2908210 RepID=UPI001F3B7C12|nr:DUF4249 domain-containing protein [Antarcticibacterium sp. 1MA-6-2]UJH91168.1 DUF4249 domain-containing protein [Antarcticibacterium sp. 1MA-6-2]